MEKMAQEIIQQKAEVVKLSRLGDLACGFKLPAYAASDWIMGQVHHEKT